MLVHTPLWICIFSSAQHLHTYPHTLIHYIHTYTHTDPILHTGLHSCLRIPTILNLTDFTQRIRHHARSHTHMPLHVYTFISITFACTHTQEHHNAGSYTLIHVYTFMRTTFAYISTHTTHTHTHTEHACTVTLVAKHYDSF